MDALSPRARRRCGDRAHRRAGGRLASHEHAVTFAAAFVGISIALWGGPGWESADDWAALLASLVIALNGVHMLRPAFHDLTDRIPGAEVVGPVRRAANDAPACLGWPGDLASVQDNHRGGAGMRRPVAVQRRVGYHPEALSGDSSRLNPENPDKT